MIGHIVKVTHYNYYFILTSLSIYFYIKKIWLIKLVKIKYYKIKKKKSQRIVANVGM